MICLGNACHARDHLPANSWQLFQFMADRHYFLDIHLNFQQIYFFSHFICHIAARRYGSSLIWLTHPRPDLVHQVQGLVLPAVLTKQRTANINTNVDLTKTVIKTSGAWQIHVHTLLTKNIPHTTPRPRQAAKSMYGTPSFRDIRERMINTNMCERLLCPVKNGETWKYSGIRTGSR